MGDYGASQFLGGATRWVMVCDCVMEGGRGAEQDGRRTTKALSMASATGGGESEWPVGGWEEERGWVMMMTASCEEEVTGAEREKRTTGHGLAMTSLERGKERGRDEKSIRGEGPPETSAKEGIETRFFHGEIRDEIGLATGRRKGRHCCGCKPRRGTDHRHTQTP